MFVKNNTGKYSSSLLLKFFSNSFKIIHCVDKGNHDFDSVYSDDTQTERFDRFCNFLVTVE